MSNSRDLATRPAGAVTAPLAEPRLSARLASAVDALLHPHPDIGPRVDGLPVHVQSEAAMMLRRYEALCAPAGPDAVRRWLLPLNSAVRNPLPPAEFERRAAVIAVAVGELPAAVFVPRTQRIALATFQFWPAAADVHTLLWSEAVPLTAKRDGLRRIASGRPNEERPRPGQAEREAILAKFRADMGAAHPARVEAPGKMPVAAARPKGRPVTPAQLAAIRAQSGVRS